MAEFFLVYHGGGRPETPEAGKEMMDKWRVWMTGLGDSVVDPGKPAGMSKTVGPDGIVDNGGSNPICGVTTVQADTIEEALEMAGSCPHITLMGGSIEVAEAMDMEM